MDIDRFRSYLLLLVRIHPARGGDARIDPSDVVQQTLLDAHRRRDQFRGQSPAEMAAWLRRLLACNLRLLHLLLLAQLIFLQLPVIRCHHRCTKPAPWCARASTALCHAASETL